MPVSRGKSCQQCRSSKVRCSLSSPCLRCSKRGLDCLYHVPLRPGLDTDRSTKRLRDIRPAIKSYRPEPNSPKLTAVARSAPVADGAAFEQSDLPDHDDAEARPIAVEPSAIRPANSDVISPVIEQEQGSERQSQCSTHLGLATPSTLSTDESLSTDADRSNSNRETPPSEYSAQFQVEQPTTLDPSHLLSPSSTQGPQLTQRGRSLQQGSLTARMLFSRLTQFTRTMVDCDQLPPFIRPPCWSSDVGSCVSGLRHACLSQTLSLCASNVALFYNSASANLSSSWRRIRYHLLNLQSEVKLFQNSVETRADPAIGAKFERYDEQETLQAMQAAVIYGILCSQSLDRTPPELSGLAVTCIESFGKRLFDMVPWGRGADSKSLLYSQWVTIESIRRLGCTIYLIDLLLQSSAKTPARSNCVTFWSMPLPCSRKLWECTSESSWRRHYSEYIDRRNRRGWKGLTLGDLLVLRQSSRLDAVVAKAGGSAVAEELAEWCEQADELAMLLWMALTVEGEGQSQGDEVLRRQEEIRRRTVVSGPGIAGN